MKPANASKLHASRADFELIARVVSRAFELFENADGEPTTGAQRMSLHMDITACHLNGTPLRLAELADAADADVVHDVGGIIAHIDRDTGRLGGCFLPRYAKT